MVNITLFKFSKRVNSLSIPPGGSGINTAAAFKDDTGKINPEFILNITTPFQYNYLQWDDRYYYITDVISESNTRFRFVCNMDILATYASNIRATSAYVKYSSSNYDDRIVDDRFSTIDRAEYSTSEAEIIPYADSGSGTYILQYKTSAPSLGPSGCAYLTQAQALQVAQAISSDGMKSWMENNDKQLNDAFSSVISMKWIPMKLMSLPVSAAPIVLGGYGTGISGTTPQKQFTNTAQLAIPWKFTDWRNQEPYTSMMLWLPSIGFVPLNPSDFIGKTSLTITASFDGINGNVAYTVDNVAHYEGSIATAVSMSSSAVDTIGSIGQLIAGIGGLAGGALTGNAGAAFVGTGSLIHGLTTSNTRQYGTTGSTGSFCSATVKPPFTSTWSSAGLVLITHSTNQNPTDVVNTLGLNCRQVLSLSGLSGYVETINASVSAPTSDDVIERINAYLNGGIYL